MDRHLVILSGGLDSTTVLAWVVRQCGRENVDTISFNYGQRHVEELNAAAAVAEFYRVPHYLRSVLLGTGGVLMHHKDEMPHLTYEELHGAEGPSPTYVPFRNGTFLSLATSFALEKGASLLWAGMHGEDAHNWAYPDCTPEFIGAMQNAIYVGTYHKVRLQVPFQYLVKADIVKFGMGIEAPFHLTLSCYEGRRPACGRCPTCVARLAAFKRAGFKDPLLYEDWEVT